MGEFLTLCSLPLAANIGTQTVSARVPSSPTLPRGAPQYKYSSAVRNIQPLGSVPPGAPQVAPACTLGVLLVGSPWLWL